MSSSQYVWRAGAVGRRGVAGAMLAAATLAACTPPVKQYELEQLSLSCDDANRFSYRTLRTLSFQITEFEPAEPGRAGVIEARRERRAPDPGVQTATVGIECTPVGATIDAREGGRLLQGVDFKRAFHHAFTGVVAMTTAREAMEEEIAAGTAPASQQRHDLQVVVQPLRRHESKLHFDIDLVAGGVLPVRIDITNHTSQHYTVDPGEIRLRRADRRRVYALSPADAAERIAAASSATEDGEAPPPPAIAAQLREKLFTVTTVRPRDRLTGYLFFPLADYTRARVVVTERESEETEGFMVEFSPGANVP